MSNNSKQRRSNLWICIVYPDDSLPENYENIIQGFHVPVLLSPVHDADLNADESEKKKHIHVMIDFGSGQNKSYDQVFELTSQLKGSIPIICQNRSAMIRYFVHKDNPEKHQYDINDLRSFSGFEYHQAFENYSNEIQIYKFIEDIIFDNMIYNYAVLCRYMQQKGYAYEYNFLRKHTLHFKALLDGQYQLITSGRQIITDSSSDINDYVYIKDVKDK